jgi:hypothetical protein
VTVDGVDAVTSFSARREYETEVIARDEDGDVVAQLWGNERNTMTAEGYTSAASVPALATDTAGDGKVEMLGLSGKIMNVECRGSNEDFVRVSVEARGYVSLAAEY